MRISIKENIELPQISRTGKLEISKDKDFIKPHHHDIILVDDDNVQVDVFVFLSVSGFSAEHAATISQARGAKMYVIHKMR